MSRISLPVYLCFLDGDFRLLADLFLLVRGRVAYLHDKANVRLRPAKVGLLFADAPSKEETTSDFCCALIFSFAEGDGQKQAQKIAHTTGQRCVTFLVTKDSGHVSLDLDDANAWMSLVPDITGILAHPSLKTWYDAAATSDAAENLLSWFMRTGKADRLLSVGFYTTLYDFEDLRELLPVEFTKLRRSRAPLRIGEEFRVLVINVVDAVSEVEALSAAISRSFSDDTYTTIGLVGRVVSKTIAPHLEELERELVSAAPHVLHLHAHSLAAAVALKFKQVISSYQARAHQLKLLVLLRGAFNHDLARSLLAEVDAMIGVVEPLPATNLVNFSATLYSKLLGGSTISRAASAAGSKGSCSPQLVGYYPGVLVPWPIRLPVRNSPTPVPGTRTTGVLLQFSYQNRKVSQLEVLQIAAAAYLMVLRENTAFSRSLLLPKTIALCAVGRCGLLAGFLLGGPTAALIAYKEKFTGTLVANVHVEFNASIQRLFPLWPAARFQLQCPWNEAELAYLSLLVDCLNNNKRWPVQPQQCSRLKWLGGVCWNCGESGVRLLLCKKCESARYCTKTCQLQHWDVHRSICVVPIPYGPLPTGATDYTRVCATAVYLLTLGYKVLLQLLRVSDPDFVRRDHQDAFVTIQGLSMISDSLAAVERFSLPSVRKLCDFLAQFDALAAQLREYARRAHSARATGAANILADLVMRSAQVRAAVQAFTARLFPIVTSFRVESQLRDLIAGSFSVTGLEALLQRELSLPNLVLFCVWDGSVNGLYGAPQFPLTAAPLTLCNKPLHLESVAAPDLDLTKLNKVADALCLGSGNHFLLPYRLGDGGKVHVATCSLNDLVVERLLRIGQRFAAGSYEVTLSEAGNQPKVRKTDSTVHLLDNFLAEIGLHSWLQLKLLPSQRSVVELCNEYSNILLARALWAVPGVWRVETFFVGEEERFRVTMTPETNIAFSQARYPVLSGVEIEKEPEIRSKPEVAVFGCPVTAPNVDSVRDSLKAANCGTLAFLCASEHVHYAVTALHVLEQLECVQGTRLSRQPVISNLTFSALNSDAACDIAWLSVNDGDYTCAIPGLDCTCLKSCDKANKASEGDLCDPTDIDWAELSRMQGSIVAKKGATTGETTGRLRSVLAFTRQAKRKVEVEWETGRVFSDNGDSGALYWLQYRGKLLPLAVHLGGDGESTSYGIRISEVWKSAPEDGVLFCAPSCTGRLSSLCLALEIRALSDHSDNDDDLSSSADSEPALAQASGKQSLEAKFVSNSSQLPFIPAAADLVRPEC